MIENIHTALFDRYQLLKYGIQTTFDVCTSSLDTIMGFVLNSYQYYLKVVVHATSMPTYLISTNNHIYVLFMLLT